VSRKKKDPYGRRGESFQPRKQKTEDPRDFQVPVREGGKTSPSGRRKRKVTSQQKQSIPRGDTRRCGALGGKKSKKPATKRIRGNEVEFCRPTGVRLGECKCRGGGAKIKTVGEGSNPFLFGENNSGKKEAKKSKGCLDGATRRVQGG